MKIITDFDEGEENRLIEFLKTNKNQSFIHINLRDINIQNFTSLSLLKSIKILCFYNCTVSNIKFPKYVRDLHVRNSRVSGELEFPANIESIVIERSEIEKIYCIPNISSMSLIDISLDNLFLKILPANLQKLTLSHIDNVNLDLLPPNLEYLMLEKVTFSEQYKILHRYLPETLKSLDIRNLSNKIIYKIQPNIREILTEDADNLCIIHFHLKKLGKVIKTRNCKYYTKHKVLFMKEIRDSLFYTSGIYTRSICSDMISRYYYITKIKSKLFRYLLDVSIENIYNPYHPNCVILRIFTKT